MKRAIGFIAILMTLVLILSGCTTDTPTPAATPTTMPAMQAEIVSLQDDVAHLTETVTSLTAQVSTSAVPVDTTPLEIAIANVDAKVSNVTARVAELENATGVKINDDGTVTVSDWEEVRWRYDVEIEYELEATNYEGEEVTPPEYVDDIRVDIEKVDPRTIREEDIYDIQISVCNYNEDYSVDLKDVVFIFTLNPDDYAYLDEDQTYLDSDSKPYLNWDSSFVVREREGMDVTRRVEFESDELSSLRIGENDCEDFDLVLELYYG